MSLMKVVAGNTIFIKWVIQKNSSITIENPKILLVDVFRKQCNFEYDVNVSDKKIEITGTYQGKFQKTMGKYSLVFFNNYQENNQNKLVYKDAFILVHALKNKLSSYDEIIDDTVLVEIDSDLSVALMNQEIQDKDDIIEQISELSDTISDMQDQIDNISISDDVIEELENRFDSSFIALNSSIDVLNTSIDSLIETLDVSFNNIVDEIEKSERVLVEYFSIIDNSVNMLMNSSTQDFDDTVIKNRIADVSLYAIDLSTRLNDVSVRLSQSGGGSGEVDLTEVNASINDLSTRLNDVSLRLLQSNITGSGRAEFDDLVFYRPLKQIPQSWLNTSMACFHDIIFNVSYFGASSAQDGRYKINLESGNWINLDKIAYYQVSESGYRYHYSYDTNGNPWDDKRIYRVDQNYFAFHFLHQEKIVSVNWAVNDVSNSIFFRIEDQI